MDGGPAVCLQDLVWGFARYLNSLRQRFRAGRCAGVAGTLFRRVVRNDAKLRSRKNVMRGTLLRTPFSKVEARRGVELLFVTLAHGSLKRFTVQNSHIAGIHTSLVGLLPACLVRHACVQV